MDQRLATSPTQLVGDRDAPNPRRNLAHRDVEAPYVVAVGAFAAYYRATRGMWTVAFRDGPSIEALREPMSEYERYIELAEPKLSERALMVVDNLLMGGEVALPEGADTRWRPESLASARRLSADLLNSGDWLACVLPVGDGIGVAVRR